MYVLFHNGGREMHKGFWWEIQKEGDHCEDQDVGGWIIVKWILDKECHLLGCYAVWLL
jgi:hypothetical protein